MIDMEPRALSQLAKSLGYTWEHLAKADEAADKAQKDLLVLLSKQVGEKFASEDANVVVFGSLARKEWIDYVSDLDWTYLIDGQAKSPHLNISQDIQAALRTEFKTTNISNEEKKEYRFAEPGPTGTFGNMTFSHELIHRIGGQDDTNRNTTQRILLLLESKPIGAKNAYDRVARTIIKGYLDEQPHLLIQDKSCFKVPRFLLNDIVRFWRTMAVDFASKQRDRGGKGWGLRNTKLRMSRKLIFASGLLICFSCQLDTKLQAKISTVSRDINLAHLENHIWNYVTRTPLDILAAAVGEYGIENEVAAKLFSAYDAFIAMMSDKQSREHLKDLKSEESRKDEIFSKVQAISKEFEGALHHIFFENETLAPLTRKYGVF
jgi:hypothetical protein